MPQGRPRFVSFTTIDENSLSIAIPWRARDIPAYGVYPYPITAAELEDMPGNDERVPVEGLEQGTDMLEAGLRDVAVAR